MPRLSLVLCIVAVVGAAISAVLFLRVNNAKKLLEVQLTTANAHAAKLAADLAVATEQTTQLQASVATTTADLVATREKLTVADKRTAALDRELAQSLGKVAVYEQTARAMSEEIAGLKAELADTKATFVSPADVSAYKNTIAELERQLATASNGAAAPTATGAATAVFANRPGRATVLSIGPSNAFVVLDFGSARGALRGQRLNINQGTEIVATVLISDVRTNFSIAQVQPDSLRGVLQKGDLALLIR